MLGRRCAYGTVCTAMVIWVMASGASAQSPTDIALAIQAELAKNEDLSNVTFTTEGAVVTLLGEAPSIFARAQAIEIARRTGGVEAVINDVTIPPAESDEAIAEGVVNAIRGYPHITIWDHVDGVVNDGQVRLEGMVTGERDKRAEIALEVAKVRGVQEVVVNIQVASPSSQDERLRQAIARRLISAGDPFERFQSMVNPPIRILVNNSVVTLLGYLGNEIDNIRLEQIVGQTQGVLRVDNYVVLTR